MGSILAITGGTGKKTGGAFIRQLAANREAVGKTFPGGIRALTRASSDTSQLTALFPGAEIFPGSMNDASYLDAALSGVDTVVHIAGIHRSRKLVEAACRQGVRRLILMHTTGIYSKYKQAGEAYRQIDADVYRMCKEHGIVLTILRPTMIYGNVSDCNVVTFIKMADRFPVMPVVNGARYGLQPVHYEDLGKALCSVLMNETATANRDYILSGKEPILLRDMLAAIGTHLGKNMRFASCPFPVAYAGAWALFLLTGKKKDYREKVQRLCEPRVFSHEDATRDFGYDPVGFEEGVANEVKEYLSLKKNRSL